MLSSSPRLERGGGTGGMASSPLSPPLSALTPPPRLERGGGTGGTSSSGLTPTPPTPPPVAAGFFVSLPLAWLADGAAAAGEGAGGGDLDEGCSRGSEGDSVVGAEGEALDEEEVEEAAEEEEDAARGVGGVRGEAAGEEEEALGAREARGETAEEGEREEEEEEEEGATQWPFSARKEGRSFLREPKKASSFCRTVNLGLACC